MWSWFGRRPPATLDLRTKDPVSSYAGARNALTYVTSDVPGHRMVLHVAGALVYY